MSKHTPGPWRISKVGDFNALICNSELSIAEVLDDAYPEVEEMQANANLIAAAPELLAELKGMVSLVELMLSRLGAWPDGECFAAGSSQMPSARAAIAKAIGDPQ